VVEREGVRIVRVVESGGTKELDLQRTGRNAVGVGLPGLVKTAVVGERDRSDA
jgi:hypothetical protein